MLILKDQSVRIDQLQPAIVTFLLRYAELLERFYDRATIVTSGIRTGPQHLLHQWGQAVDLRVPSRSPAISPLRAPSDVAVAVAAAAARSVDRHFDAAVFKALNPLLLGGPAPRLNEFDFIHETFADSSRDHFHVEWQPRQQLLVAHISS